MREFKFRGWDIKNNRMSHMYLEGIFSHYENGSMKLMQFTGFYDIDEKEVYEGDLVTFPMDESKTIFKVKFDTEIGAWMLDCWEHLGENSHLLKVIGNVYENQELLENKNGHN